MKKSLQLSALVAVLALVSWLSMGVEANACPWLDDDNGVPYPACNVTHCAPCYAEGTAKCWWAQACEPINCYCDMATSKLRCRGWGACP